MARLPYQVLVIPFFAEDGHIIYCVFKRANLKSQIQFVAGGGENDEMPAEAASRELFEESGVDNADIQPLTSISYIPTHIFSKPQKRTSGKDIFVIPEYSFSARVNSKFIRISDEHNWFKWVLYEEALRLLKWDSNKTALYELDCRLINSKANMKESSSSLGA